MLLALHAGAGAAGRRALWQRGRVRRSRLSPITIESLENNCTDAAAAPAAPPAPPPMAGGIETVLTNEDHASAKVHHFKR